MLRMPSVSERISRILGFHTLNYNNKMSRSNRKRKKGKTLQRSIGMIAVIVTLGSTAYAHEGVKDKNVKERMDNMSAIADQTKVIGEMAKGAVALDLPKARAAADELSRLAAQITALFETQAQDPKSEARDDIWKSFSAFSAKAQDLQVIAAGIAANANSKDDLGAGMVALGGACRACHSEYRQ